MLPQPQSPAIGHGSVALIPAGVTEDQRGLPQIVDGGVDIGAVETQTGKRTASVSPGFARVSLPSTVIAGAKLNAKLRVVVTNQGGAFAGNVAVNIYADSGTSLDGGQLLLASSEKNVSLKSGGSAVFNADIKSLAKTAAGGAYHLLAEAVDPGGATSVTATTQTIEVVAPFVTPSVSFVLLHPAVVYRGSVIRPPGPDIRVTVGNNGNVTARGIDITLNPSADGATPDAAIVLDQLTLNAVTIKPGKKKSFRMIFDVQAAAGGNFLFVSASFQGPNATNVATATLSNNSFVL